jgi:hypothetical protein
LAKSITWRRSSRSTSAPAGSAHNSHGKVRAVVTPAMSAGLRVTVKATRGNPTLKSPSARLDKLDDDHRVQNPAPRGAG